MTYISLIGDDVVCHNGNYQLTNQDICFLSQNLDVLDSFSEDATTLSVLSLAKECELPNEYDKVPLRTVFATSDLTDVMLYARAKALTEWRKNCRFCGCCGQPMKDHQTLTARYCSACGHLTFPRIEPCIIVLVSKGDEILLARHVQRNQNIYACIAGFMEAGETAEQAVEREIMEETGLTVRNIQYFGSQSWPFPAQLMLAFTAEYESGELKLQEDELSDAQWFRRDACPASPRPGSIAYRLIHSC